MTEQNKIQLTNKHTKHKLQKKHRLVATIVDVLNSMPDVYSLKANDYSQFVIHKNARDIMEENWLNIGERLGVAINKVGNEAKKIKAK